MADSVAVAKAKELVALVTANASFLTRAKCFKANGSLSDKDYNDWAKGVLQVKGAEPEATVQSRVLASADWTNDKANIAIDPYNRYQIFTDIIWSTIGAASTPGYAPGLKGDDTKKQLDSTCRGVRYKEVYLGAPATAFQTAFFEAFETKDYYENSWLDANDATKKLQEQQKVLNELKVIGGLFTSDGTNNRKEVFSALFSSDEMAKLFFVHNYLLDTSIGNPWGLMGYDPYLAYLSVYTAWISSNGLNSRKADGNSLIAPLKAAAGGTMDFGSWSSHINTDDARANLAQQAIKFLEITGKWLQSQKTDENTKEYFTGWNNSFIVDPKCMVNMLVIVNELVNVPNLASKYNCAPKVRAYQEALSLAYKKFEMEIGD